MYVFYLPREIGIMTSTVETFQRPTMIFNVGPTDPCHHGPPWWQGHHSVSVVRSTRAKRLVQQLAAP
jgi:hypothetical protein